MTGASLDDFVMLVSKANGGRGPSRMVPFISMKDVQKKRVFDENGDPIAKAWDRFAFPDFGDERAFAMRISNDVAAPVFRSGHVVVVSPFQPANVSAVISQALFFERKATRVA